MAIINNKPHRQAPHCNICKRSIEWKKIDGMWVAVFLTGEPDTCYSFESRQAWKTIASR